MRKLHVVWLAIAAVFALGAVFASAASAETTLLAEWLNNAKPIPAGQLLSTTAEGKLLLEDTSNKGAVVCEGVLMGSVGANGEDEITSVLTKGTPGTEVTLTARLKCEADPEGSACEKNATDVEAAPENLPWKTLLFLKLDGTYLDAVWKAAYSVTCLVIIKITDECEIEEVATQEVENGTGGVVAKGSVSPLSHCSVGGAGTGLITALAGNLLTLDPPNGPLTVSSEP